MLVCLVLHPSGESNEKLSSVFTISGTEPADLVLEHPRLCALALHERRLDRVRDGLDDGVLVQEVHLALRRVHVHVDRRGREREADVHERARAARERARVRGLGRAPQPRALDEPVVDEQQERRLARVVARARDVRLGGPAELVLRSSVREDEKAMEDRVTSLSSMSSPSSSLLRPGPALTSMSSFRTALPYSRPIVCATLAPAGVDTSAVAEPACTSSEYGPVRSRRMTTDLLAHKRDGRVVHRIAGDDVQDPCVLFGRRAQCRKPSWRVVEHVFYLGVLSAACELWRRGRGHAVIVVPPFPAHAFGSALVPGLGGARAPSK
jgi:hypothetical protein